MHDVIVIGGGPAGASAAVTAARAGLRTALVDKARFPRDKLCGGGFTGRSLSYFQQIFDAPRPDAPMLCRNEMAFYAFGQHLGTYQDCPPLYLAMRRSLDAELCARAIAAGAEDFTGRAMQSLTPDGAVTLVDGTLLKAPVVIGADGVNSPTARSLFGTAFNRHEIGFALEVECDTSPDTLPVRIDFGAADWGYGWAFPKQHGVTVGVGGLLRRNPDLKSLLERYLVATGLESHSTVKGQFLPFGHARKQPGKGRVLLAGDAAGLVDPITGEGIAYAMKSGQMAALAGIQSLAKGTPETALTQYRQDLRAITKAIGQARFLRQLMFRPIFRRVFINSFVRSTHLRHEYLRLLAGETEYSGLSRSISRRLPRYFWRTIANTR
ncbi:NAD(P)/FAD-dependent oxidoreductase [Primorskyibacter flagellatus]|uniref:Geranylgeranyl reductase family n=1 Tax=Primorskyibacter flagellatus TaxID=1387277 RepID=A0A1W2BQ56_9RHOB|nr:geranylgeranyl reductase family protein [Primorskyibacter flagellatus]SMC75089.1 geranylgeranyl reductase family [Primorskyibacter flagellatus]